MVKFRDLLSDTESFVLVTEIETRKAAKFHIQAWI